MTNFDFLKNFNKELYEIGVKLEDDVINSPRAVTADATVFLENLVKDIYRRSNKKLEKNLISFYKKIDHLYRSGVITYIYKNKLQEAYNLRNKIHKDSLDPSEEKRLAFDLDKRLYYIAKKYFRDYCENERYIKIPDYKKPSPLEIRFDNCIICGSSNKKSQSNMCRTCNQKIENANIMLSLQNTLRDTAFTRFDLIDLGVDESKAILLLMDLSKYDAIVNKGEYYIFNPENFDYYLAEINKYVEIGLLITKFYKNEITAGEIKKTEEYINGKDNQKPYREFFRLANQKIEKDFEKNLLQFKNIKKSIKVSEMDESNIEHWYYKEKEAFGEGILNDAFILYNELLINEFFTLKKRGHYDEAILKKLNISPDIYNFWQTQFMAGSFFKKTRNIKQKRLISEIKNNKSLDDALYSAQMGKRDFKKIINYAKEENDEFYKDFDKEYTKKRQKILIKHLRKHDLNRAIRLTKILKREFMEWYWEGEKTFSEFYLTVTELLMEKYIHYRKNDWDKKDIIKRINISKELFNSWSKHTTEHKLFRDFEQKNKKITTLLIKRGLVINAIKEGKGKEEAIFSANLTPRDFVEIYNNSKREKTEYHLRFDREYEKSRKRKFTKLIVDNDFYYSIQKSEISQAEFNAWYLKDQDAFMATNNPSAFYLTTTCELMDKYLKARLNGKNKPDAAKSVGLSNTIINKWIKHPEYDIYYDFKKKNKQTTIDLIVNAFSNAQSKIEVSENCDIPLSTIEEFIDFGKNGFQKYREVFELYEDRVIPAHLDIFLKGLKTKSLYKSLKQAKLSKEELDYYYQLGKLGYEKFTGFYNDYLDAKVNLYVSSIISKKSVKIAMKNSNLTIEELGDNHDAISEMILNKRLDLIYDALRKNKNSGAKIAKSAGITIDDVYEWYFKGREGDERYSEFSTIFELECILPRVAAFRKATALGIPKKFLLKKIKKEMGVADYKIWDRYDMFNQTYEFYDIENERLQEKKIIHAMDSLDFYKSDKRDFKTSKRRGKTFEDELKSLFNVSFVGKSEAFGK